MMESLNEINDFEEPGELVKDTEIVKVFKHRDRSLNPIQNESLLFKFYENEFFRLCREHNDSSAISKAAENMQRCSSSETKGVTYSRFLAWLQGTDLSMRKVKAITGRDMRKPRPLEKKTCFTEDDLEIIASLAR